MAVPVWRSRLVRCAFAVVAIGVVGYLSNSVTATVCEQNTNEWLSGNLARYTTIWPNRGKSSEPASFTFPWIIGVKYWWAVSPTGGEGGTRFYVCLFGIAIPVRNRIEVLS